jgi:hypothetical protein
MNDRQILATGFAGALAMLLHWLVRPASANIDYLSLGTAGEVKACTGYTSPAEAVPVQSRTHCSAQLLDYQIAK